MMLDPVLKKNERVLPRQMTEQQHFALDPDLLHPQDHCRGASQRIAVGADVRGNQYALAAREDVDDLLMSFGHVIAGYRCIRTRINRSFSAGWPEGAWGSEVESNAF